MSLTAPFWNDEINKVLKDLFGTAVVPDTRISLAWHNELGSILLQDGHFVSRIWWIYDRDQGYLLFPLENIKPQI
jgi:hypothetical protein